MDIAEITVPLPVFKTFHYKIPPNVKVELGSQVLVNFKNRNLLGYVVGFPEQKFSDHKIKEILDVPHPKPLFSETMLQFLKWISSYYAAPLGEVMKSAVPPKLNLNAAGGAKTGPPDSPQPGREAALGGESGVFWRQDPQRRKLALLLTDQQKIVLSSLESALNIKTFSPFLLHGVTGSGKTEIYLRIIQGALEKKRTALVLVPEISLTPQVISRFESHFPQNIAVLHSRLTPKEKQKEWIKIYNNEASIVIGTRSAIFAPLENLGVIVIDEEHDSSFKQEEKLRYNARDLALIRGKLEKSVVILGSATPSLESYFNVQIKKIRLLALPERVHQRPLPEVKIIDMKNKEGFFSEELLLALKETLFQKSQAMLLLNRRGYAPFLLCHTCGYVYRCSHCSVSFTVYANEQKLICHYCSHTMLMPLQCGDCGSDKLDSMGIGTQKVEEELKKYFPEARIMRMDRSSTQKKDAFFNILSDFSNQKIDILIGTQMIAKGHDFPNVTLVGVILAETSLNLPDFRSPEKTFQLLTQVSGRAGRGDKPGRVIIQTFNPSHYSLTFTEQQYYEGFYKMELLYREEASYPPFSKLVHFKCAHANQKKALDKIKSFYALLKSIQSQKKEFSPCEILGPAPAPLSKIKDKYRFHILLKIPSYKLTKAFLNEIISQEMELKIPPAIQIDVDPLNLL